jgi:hypothetical protein
MKVKLLFSECFITATQKWIKQEDGCRGQAERQHGTGPLTAALWPGSKWHYLGARVDSHKDKIVQGTSARHQGCTGPQLQRLPSTQSSLHSGHVALRGSTSQVSVLMCHTQGHHSCSVVMALHETMWGDRTGSSPGQAPVLISSVT